MNQCIDVIADVADVLFIEDEWCVILKDSISNVLVEHVT